MLLRHWRCIAWPAFLAAGAMEMIVFAFVDPMEISWLANHGDFSRMSIYTAAFFVFWGVIMMASAMTSLLALSAAELNQRAPVVE